MSDQDTKATEDKTEVAETSTTEEVQDTEVTGDLEDDETSFDDAEDDETEEPEDSEAENEDTEPAELEEKSEEDVEPTEPEKPEEESPAETKEEDTTPEESTKRFNAEQAKRRIAEREARKAKDELERQNLQRYLDEAGDDELERGRRELEVQAHNILKEKAQLNADRLESGIEKAVATIPLFQTGSPEVKAELARRLEDFEAKHVQYDKQGRPVNVTADVYAYLQNEADSLEQLLNSSALTRNKAKDRAKARTDTLPSRAPKEKPVDPDMAAFDEEIAKLQ